MILLNVGVVIVPSMPKRAAEQWWLAGVERVAVDISTLKYPVRPWTWPWIWPWTCPVANRFGPAWRGRPRQIKRPLALIDLAAVLPFYLAPFADANTLVFRLLRVYRLVSVLKFGRYHTSLGILDRVALSRGGADEFPALVLVLVFISSSLLYGVEHDAQPRSCCQVFRHRRGGGS